MRDEFISKFKGEEIDEAVDLILNGVIPSISVDNVLSTESEHPVQNKVITQKINEIINELIKKADSEDVYSKTDNLLSAKANSNDVYTKTETINLLSAKANSNDVYTKTEADNLLSAKADSEDVYSKTETDNLLSAKANSNDVYTKSETNTFLNAKMENPMTSMGDLIYGGPNGSPMALTKGTAGQVLKATTTGVEWAQESGGITKDLLWTNSNTATAFTNQIITISHNILDYKYLLIDFYQIETGYSFYSLFETIMIINNNDLSKNQCLIIFIDSSGGIYTRPITYNDTNKLEVHNARHDNQNNNGWCIPYQVYGVK